MKKRVTIVATAVLIIAAVTVSLYTSRRNQARPVPQSNAAPDTVPANGMDVITTRLAGLSDVAVRVSAAVPSAISCRLIAPDKTVTSGTLSGDACTIRLVAPMTGSYQIEVQNDSAFDMPYAIATTSVTSKK